MKPIRTICSIAAACLLGFGPAVGCDTPERKKPDFHTSGSREADQRAEQQVAKVQQLRGEGVGDDKKSKSDTSKTGVAMHGDKDNVKKSLFERLGGEPGVG